MIHVTEEQSAALASHELAFAAVRAALIAARNPAAASFPALTDRNLCGRPGRP